MNKLNSASIISDSHEEYNIYDEERRGPQYYVPLLIIITLLLICFFWLGYTVIQIPEYFTEYEAARALGEPIKKVAEIQPVEITQEVIEEKEEAPAVHLTDEDIVAAVVMSEAGNQDLLGKVAVAAVILNRADYYDMTVEQVVNAPHQFSYPYTGIVTHECYRAVEIAESNRDLFPEDMMWFRTGSYHEIGMPYEKLGDHYFSYLGESEETKND